MTLLRRTPLAILGCSLVAAALALESGINRERADPNIRVQDDLYRAVNGHWLATTEIPPDKSNYGAFTILDDLSCQRVQALIEKAAAQSQPEGSEARKIADVYRSFMDEARIEKLGLQPLQADLAAIDRLKTQAEVARHFGTLFRLGVVVPIAFDVDVDERASTQYIAQLAQSGTLMPDRDYYLLDEERFQQVRAAYRDYLQTLFTFTGAGADQAATAARNTLKIETELAAAQWTRTQLRDAEKNYNKIAMAGLPELGAGFPWTDYFGGLHAPALDDIDVQQPPFVKQVAAIFTGTPVEQWKEYLKLHLLDAYAIGLAANFQRAHFEFHGKTLGGIPQDKPRTEKAVELISGREAHDFGVLGDSVGRLYVAKYFPPDAKSRMDRIVANLLAAYGASIDDLTWMTAETKAKAREKLSKYAVKIGYPEHPRDYSALKITAGDMAGNLKASREFKYNRRVQRYGQPVDRTEWHMTPQTVNAYYNPSGNEIVFPAAILQPPFFNVAADDAANYGGIGAVIGHEISHGFDDQGSRYDGDGNLHNWWTEADRKAFEALTSRLVEQYSAYEPLPGQHVNGKLTLGENIADLSGLAIAYKAYHRSLNGREAPVIDGMTGDQRFFQGWSQVWARKYRDAEMIKRLKTDPHSPSHYRANGPASNSTPFHEAFGIKPGDKMYKPAAERIRIW